MRNIFIVAYLVCFRFIFCRLYCSNFLYRRSSSVSVLAICDIAHKQYVAHCILLFSILSLRLCLCFPDDCRLWFVSDESGQLETAFESTPYRDTEKMSENFTQFLEKLASFDASSGFTSLYVAMVQSSGSGKTRFALEIPRLLHSSRVAYLCLRVPSSSGAVAVSFIFCILLQARVSTSFDSFLPCFPAAGYPLRSESSTSVLVGFQVHGLRFALYLLTHFARRIMLHEYGILEGTGKEALQSHDEFWKHVAAQTTQSSQELETPVIMSDNSIVLQCTDMLSQITSQTSSSSGSPIRFFGVIDEARALLSTICNKDTEKRSAFRLLRQALKLLHAPLRRIGCLILLLDTISNVSNFVPALRFDPSFRGTEPSKKIPFGQAESRHLFPPFFNFPVLRRAPVPDLKQIHPALYWDHFLRGRPLWHSYFVTNASLTTLAAVKDELLRVLQIAQSKLMGGDANHITYSQLLGSLSQNRDQSLVSSAACLAVCGSLVQCIEPFPSSAVATQMLSGHMVPIVFCVLLSV